jgi:hypothetical protein
MTLNCDGCRSRIKRGEQHVTVNRHIETVGMFGAAKVHDAELLAIYHLDCEPAQIVVERAS